MTSQRRDKQPEDERREPSAVFAELDTGELGDAILIVRNALAELDDRIGDLMWSSGFRSLTACYLQRQLPLDELEGKLAHLSEHFPPVTASMNKALAVRDVIRRGRTIPCAATAHSDPALGEASASDPMADYPPSRPTDDLDSTWA